MNNDGGTKLTRPPSEGSTYISTEDFIVRLAVSLGAAYLALLGASFAFILLSISAVLPPDDIGLLPTIALSFIISILAIMVFRYFRDRATSMFGEARHKSINGWYDQQDWEVILIFLLFAISSLGIFLGTQQFFGTEAIPTGPILLLLKSTQYSLFTKFATLAVHIQSSVMIVLFGASVYGILYRVKLRISPSYFCSECETKVDFKSAFCEACGAELESVDS